ncbi:MAG: hypothetical protein AAF849_17085 [Bacteroidota bacterium]
MIALRCVLTIILSFGMTFLFVAEAAVPGIAFKRKVLKNNTETEITFIERDIKRFEVEIDHQLFQNLIQAYNNDPAYQGQGFKIAGFCFIPMMKDQGTGGPTDYHFITEGFRVVLTLYKIVNNQPDEIQFYKFDPARELSDALDSEFLPSPATAGAYFEVDAGSTPAGATIDTSSFISPHIITASREFDLVFLDRVTYNTLAKGTGWYPGNTRPQEGIIIERSVNTVSDTLGDPEYHRTLIFRPLPAPPLSNTVTEASVAYSYRPHCPPYWKRPLSKSLAQEISLSSAYRVDVEKDGIPRWLQILILILAALLGYLFAVNSERIIGIFRNRGDG